ncbi:amino acid adenylation domain-containing protein, partial [Pseudomonas sp. MAFF 302030]
ANRLAHYLIELGVGPEVLVGVAAHRSLEMVVALLAILKAGGAYVPLDPEYPQDRLMYMVQDSGIELLLISEHLIETLNVAAAVKVLPLRAQDDEWRVYSEDNPNLKLEPENLAYVIYTSGSTGQPKGAGNRHSALTNRLIWMQQEYGLEVSDTVLQKTPFSFDVSVWEFFWPLMTGARLAIALPGEHREPEKLVELIRREQVTTLHFVPSMLQVFMQASEVASCTTLKRIICSGEALSVDVQSQVLNLLPHAGLFNLYGPTEAAIDVTHWRCVDEGRSSVPIGRAIANLSTYILDPYLVPVPVGSLGELYLGGAGLARGYHQRSMLTAERFVVSPFEKGARLYRTGDLARHRANGVIEYVGRTDHQVKIRGLRIELGEIEARILELESVLEAVVLAQPGPAGLQLVSYIVPSVDIGFADPEDAKPLKKSMVKQLKETLPDYMIPTHLLFIQHLPLTPNGKLDRKSLPLPDINQLPREYVPALSPLEQQMASIWQSVLMVEQVGMTDSFFDLGGHSLLAVQVLTRVKQQLNVDIPVKTLFQAETLQAFCEQIQAILVTSNGVQDELAKSLEDLKRLSTDELEKLISQE